MAFRFLDSMLYGIKNIFWNGEPLPTREGINFLGGLVEDNPLTKSIDITIVGGEGVGAAADIAYGGGGTWADGTTNPAATQEQQNDKVISDLSGTGGSPGTAKIGARARAGTNIYLGAGTLDSQIEVLRDGVDDALTLAGAAVTAVDVAYAGGPAWADGTTNPATNVEAQADKIVTDLARTTDPAGAKKIGARARAGTNFSLTVGTTDAQLEEVRAAVDALMAGGSIPATDVAYAGGPAWADASTNPATTGEAQFDKIVTDLARANEGNENCGSKKIGSAFMFSNHHQLNEGHVFSQLQSVLYHLDAHKYGPGNVKFWGAVGDGVTDDTEAIQDAIDNAIEEGLTLFFPRGTYLCDTLNVVNPSGLTLKGERGGLLAIVDELDHGSVIKWSGGDTGTMIEGEGWQDVTIEDLTFWGNNPGANTVLAINLQSDNDPATHGVTFRHCAFHALDRWMLIGDGSPPSYQNDAITLEQCFGDYRAYAIRTNSANAMSASRIGNCVFTGGDAAGNALWLAGGSVTVQDCVGGGTFNSLVRLSAAFGQINNVTLINTESEGSTNHFWVDSTVIDDGHSIVLIGNTFNTPPLIEGFCHIASFGNYFSSAPAVLNAGRWMAMGDRNNDLAQPTVNNVGGVYVNFDVAGASLYGTSGAKGQILWRPPYAKQGSNAGEVCTTAGRRGQNWTASTAFAPGTIVYPTDGNGHAYRSDESGTGPYTSGASPPAWNIGSNTTDNLIVWTDLGAVAGVFKAFGPLDHYTDTAPPTTANHGYWRVGSIVWNTTPSSHDSPIGWRCVVAGSPGTWAAFYGHAGVGPSSAATLSNGLNTDVARTGSTVRIDGPTALFKIGGVAAGFDGQIVYLDNTTTQPWILQDEDAGSTAANRLSLGGVNVSLSGQSGATLKYDSTSSRWRLVAT